MPSSLQGRAGLVLALAPLYIVAAVSPTIARPPPSEPLLAPAIRTGPGRADIGLYPDPWQRPLMPGFVAGSGPAGWPLQPSDSIQRRNNASAADGVWQLYPPRGAFNPPPWRSTASEIFDAPRRRMVIFGGGAMGYLNDVWALTLAGFPVWTELGSQSPAPRPRRLHSAVYDPVRDRMIVFGGFDGGYYNDVWALSFTSLPTWTQIVPAGTPPTPRADFAMVYDPVGDRVIVFGGYDGVSAPSNRRRDVWALSLTSTPAWSEIHVADGPTPRSGHRGIYDPVRQRMVVFGGYDVAYLNDVWALSLTSTPAWTRLMPTRSPLAPRAEQSVTYDGVQDRLLVFGGQDDRFYYDDTWAMPLATPGWFQLPVSGSPVARWGQTAAYDLAVDQLVIFGGYSTGGGNNESWTLALTGEMRWLPVPLSSEPGARTTHSATFDPLRDRLVVFGGGGIIYLNDTWVLPPGQNPWWSPIVVFGLMPPPRRLHGTVYDPGRDRLILFGGYDGVFYNDVWTLSFSGVPAWTPLVTAGTPPAPRADFPMIYDPVGDRVIVFGGYDGVSAPSNRRRDVWALSLAGTPTWTEFPVADGPTARSGHRGIYDPVRQRMLVFGGYDVAYLNDVWALSLTSTPAWTRLMPVGFPPAPRAEHSLVYDPGHDRMLMFGGADEFRDDGDLWAFALSGDGRWSQLFPAGDPPPARWGHVAIEDPLHGRMILQGGTLDASLRADSYALAEDMPASAGVSRVEADAQPDRARLTWVFADGAGMTAFVERREPSSDWRRLAVVTADGTGTLVYEDRAVVAGHRYGFRLALWAPGLERYAGEIWLEIPAARTLSLAGPRPNPAMGALRVGFTLLDSAPASLELLDLGGRRLAVREVGGLGPGFHAVELRPDRPLAAGVYLLRLEQRGHVLTSKAAVLR